MKKTTLLLVMFLMSVFSFAQEQTITWESSSLPESEKGQTVTYTVTLAEGYTLKFDAGTNTQNAPVYWSTGEIRFYGSNVMTFEGKNIVKVAIYGTDNSRKATLSANTGEFEDATAKDKVWTGKTDQLILTNIQTGQYRFNKIELTYEAEGAATNPMEKMNVSPAEGEVEALSMITLTFDGATCTAKEDAMINIKKDGENYSEGFVYTNDEGDEVYIEEVESARFTQSGTYTYEIPAGAITVDGQELPAFTLEYNIAAQAIDPMDVIKITPVEGEVESLENFTITFTGISGITVNEDALVTLTKEGSEEVVDGGLMCDDGINVEVGLMDRVSAYGKYTLNIPAGAITVNGKTLEPLAFKYTIKDPNAKEYTIDPEEGKVESLQNFTITFDGYAEVLNTDNHPVLTNNTTGVSVEGGITDAQGKIIVYFSDPITEDGEYTLTIPAATIMIWAKNLTYDELTFNYTIGDPQQEEGEKLVELPAGVTPEKWYGGGEYIYYSSGWQSTDVDDTFNFQVAFDGNDVYIAGLDVNHENAWVKGTLENGTITCEGTLTGIEEFDGQEYKYYIIATESVSPYGVKPVQFTYDEEAGIIKVVNGIDITLAPDLGESGNLYAYYSGITLTREAPAADELVVLPAGVETVDYTFTGNDLTLENDGSVSEEVPFSTTVKVGIDGNDIYVQGINKDYIPEAWVKGVRNGNTVTFALGQYMGEFMYMGYYGPYKNYLIGTQLGVFNVQDIVMNVDDENGTMTAEDAVVISGKKNSVSYWNIFSDVVLTNTNVSGINEINTDDSNAVYYDTMGRRVDANTKGLVIKQVRASNGSVKTVKVVR